MLTLLFRLGGNFNCVLGGGFVGWPMQNHMYFEGPLWDQLYRAVKHLKLSCGLRTPKMLTASILMLLYFLGIATTKRVLLPITGEVSEQCFLLVYAVIYVPRLNEQWQQQHRENFPCCFSWSR